MTVGISISVLQEQGRVPVTVFRLKGHIDAHTHEEVQKQAGEAIEGGTSDLLLDLTEVTYMSSAGLQALHRIFALLRAKAADESDETMSQGLKDGTYKSAHLKLLNPSRDVREVITTAGFDMFLEIHSKFKEAIASF